jgi:PiT family inorganic phosphate transporter
MSDKLIKKLACGVYKMRKSHAISAEGSSAFVLIANSLIGGPVSATQVIAASIMGAGSAERNAGIHWLVVKDICSSWLITMPAAACLAAAFDVLIFRWAIQLLQS